MKPIIAIPSYKRPNGIAISRLKNIPLKKFLFIRPEDYDSYKSVAEENGFHIVRLKNVTDIGNTRQKIVEYCNHKGFEWVFMFDDDISKIEKLGWDKSKKLWNSQRIIDGSIVGPRFETDALRYWYKLAKRHNISLSCPIYRFDRRSKGKIIHINRYSVIQCVLVHIPDIVSVGNYKSIHVTGNEDYYMQFKLMSSGYRTGAIGLIEYDCPSVGNCDDGTSDTKEQKYKHYIKIKAFFNNVCDDPRFVTTKTTKTGFESLKFVWKNFNPENIPIEEDLIC